MLKQNSRVATPISPERPLREEEARPKKAREIDLAPAKHALLNGSPKSVGTTGWAGRCHL
jgi:hypothetical protein